MTNTNDVNLRAVAVRGAFWNISLALANKIITAAGQIALAWYLLPQDMGLVAMAASVIAIATLFTASGIDDLLVQRHQHYQEDAPQVLWISLAFNLLALGTVICLMPFASSHFSDNRVGRLMLIQALSWPVSTLTLVLIPKLKNDLRFKAIALINLGAGIIFTSSAVLLASRNYGPYALVWPILFQTVFFALSSWYLVGELPLKPPKPRLWPKYLRPGLLLMVANFVSVITIQLPNFILGSLLDARRTGLYSWGYLLAAQAVFLLAINLRGLFTPLFSKLNNDPERQAAAILRSLHIMLALVIPICVIQAFLAHTLIALFFPARWIDASPLVAWLSLGLTLQAAAIIIHAALIATGRYRLFLALSLTQALAIGLGVLLGCQQGDIVGAAFGTAIAMFACFPMYFWAAHRVTKGPWMQLLDPIKPILLSLAAALPAYSIWRLASPLWSVVATIAYVLILILLAFVFDKKIIQTIKELSSFKNVESKISRAAS